MPALQNMNFVNFIIFGLGILTLSNLFYRFVSLLCLLYLHRTTIQRFQNPDSYALITGSSGGLGHALAEHLYDRGVSVALLTKIRNLTPGVGR